ncbi:MAG: acyltransferase family protein [Bacteroidaceae bacterium]|nr:acyltransferase family protein [Bacteroidaceae bacterium]
MNKERTQVLKGIAVLFMVWMHLFTKNTSLYADPITILGKPLALFLSAGMSPVVYFLILGGYGLYSVYQRGHDGNRFRRILRLYTHYWIILAIFVPLGWWFVGANRYPGDLKNIVMNMIGLGCSYCTECWFLFPYSIISLCSVYLFKIYDRFKASHLLVATFALNFATSTLLHFYGESHINHTPWLSLPLVLIHFQFGFALGAILKREDVVERLRMFKDRNSIRNWHLAIMLVVTFLLICMVWNTPYYAFFAVFVVVAVAQFPTDNYMSKALGYIGKHSMNIWLIHGFWALHIFTPYAYAPRFPIPIFALTMCVSLLASHLVDFIARPLRR